MFGEKKEGTHSVYLAEFLFKDSGDHWLKAYKQFERFLVTRGHMYGASTYILVGQYIPDPASPLSAYPNPGMTHFEASLVSWNCK